MIDRFGLDSGVRLDGLRVAVCGFARSGRAAATLLVELGADVRVLDAAADDPDRAAAAEALGVPLRAGNQDASDLEGVSLCVASPGIAPSHPWWSAAGAAGIPWWSEIELAWRAGIRPLAAITGTNGKTTTTAMLTACLVTEGLPAHAAGNIGTPLAAFRPGTPVVAEVSSFQLAATEAFTAPVAALLNVAPDHLDWHGTFDEYFAAKAGLFTRLGPDATAVLDHARVGEIPTAARTLTFGIETGDACIRDGALWLSGRSICEVAALRRPHRPFLLDALAAAACAEALGVPDAAIADALSAFEPEAHRLETVAVVDGVRFVNDSKATDPHAAEAALASFQEPIVLMAGGRNKGLDLSGLAATGARIRAVVAFGEAAGEVAAAFADSDVAVETVDDLSEAVSRAANLAEPGDVVLLSPACASYDRFTNYEHRGDVFRAAVETLARTEIA